MIRPRLACASRKRPSLQKEKIPMIMKVEMKEAVPKMDQEVNGKALKARRSKSGRR